MSGLGARSTVDLAHAIVLGDEAADPSPSIPWLFFRGPRFTSQLRWSLPPSFPTQDAERPSHWYDSRQFMKRSLALLALLWFAVVQMRSLGLLEEILVSSNAEHKMAIIFTKQSNFLALSLGLFPLHHNCLFFFF